MNRIDLASVQVVGSPARCLHFPRTARLTHFGAYQTGIALRTTGTESWPIISIEGKPGPEDDQSATLWIFTRPDGPSGPWYATGAERLRPGQLNGEKPQGRPDIPDTLAVLIGEGWLYDASRWGRMAHYNPRPGEPVGVMVVAGSTRSDERTPLQARTQVMVIAWPAFPGENPCRVLWQEEDVVVTPDPRPDPKPDPKPDPTPDPQMTAALIRLRADYLELIQAIERLDVSIRHLHDALVALQTRVQVLEDRPEPEPPALPSLPTSLSFRLYRMPITVPVTWR